MQQTSSLRWIFQNPSNEPLKLGRINYNPKVEIQSQFIRIRPLWTYLVTSYLQNCKAFSVLRQNSSIFLNK